MGLPKEVVLLPFQWEIKTKQKKKKVKNWFRLQVANIKQTKQNKKNTEHWQLW